MRTSAVRATETLPVRKDFAMKHLRILIYVGAALTCRRVTASSKYAEILGTLHDSTGGVLPARRSCCAATIPISKAPL